MGSKKRLPRKATGRAGADHSRGSTAGARLERTGRIAAVNDFDALWRSLFPAEQARIVHLLVQRVSVSPEGIAVDLRTEWLGSVSER
jgi:hypothetical protein